MILKFIDAFRKLSRFAIMDASDNSVTFSKRLFKDLRLLELTEAKVMVFTLSGTRDYAFMVNPPLSEGTETQLAEVMINDRYHCIGFECLVPTVNRIFFDYGLPEGSKCRVTVERGQTETGLEYWKFCRPHGKK